LSELIVV